MLLNLQNDVLLERKNSRDIVNNKEERIIKLREILKKSQKSPYYNSVLECLSKEELEKADFDTLKKIPFTTKSILREVGLNILSVPLNQTIRYYESSGTTGVPTPTPKTKQDIYSNTKGLMLNWQQILQGNKDIAVLMLPSDIAPVADAMSYGLEAMNVLSVRAFPFTRGVSGWEQVIRIIESLEANVLFATPGLIIYFYYELKKRNIDPLTLGIEKIMLLGELVTDAMRNMLERLWGCHVYINSYGSSELGTCATSCVNKNLHLLSHMYHFEWICSETGEVLDSNEGELVVTTLTADARPLIRYRTGDYVRVVEKKCTCGFNTPVIEVMGRIGENIVVQGKKITPYDIEQMVFGIDGVIGYSIEFNDKDDVRLLVEIEPGCQTELETQRILEQTNNELTKQSYPLKVEIMEGFNELTKRGGGFKNWKLTHIIQKST